MISDVNQPRLDNRRIRAHYTSKTCVFTFRTSGYSSAKSNTSMWGLFNAENCCVFRLFEIRVGGLRYTAEYLKICFGEAVFNYSAIMAAVCWERVWDGYQSGIVSIGEENVLWCRHVGKRSQLYQDSRGGFWYLTASEARADEYNTMGKHCKTLSCFGNNY